MNYYPHHIGDYRKDTAHLSLLEHGVYRQLLDTYYTSEKPLPLDDAILMRTHCARSAEEMQAVKNVLTDFFVCTDDCYVHKRCDIVIEAYRQAKKNHWGNKLTKSQRCAIQANRNAAKLNATPAWSTNDHKDQIAEFYTISTITTAETGIKHEVDHIVPLRSKIVCGLHVPWNLQVLTTDKNRRKTNLLLEIL